MKVSDESFFDLLKILEEGKTKEDKPTPNKKVFSLNVDESGKVNQVSKKFEQKKTKVNCKKI